jgi:hypothetical protein
MPIFSNTSSRNRRSKQHNAAPITKMYIHTQRINNSKRKEHEDVAGESWTKDRVLSGDREEEREGRGGKERERETYACQIRAVRFSILLR